MDYIKNHLATVCLFGLALLILAACGGSGNTENKTAAKDTTDQPRWIDPQRGKIWGKVNYVQIPLTAIENHILGPVKSVRYVDFKISDKDGGKMLDDSGYNVYDKFGHLIDQNEYDKNGKLKWHCVYGYDAQNKATEWNINIPVDKMLSKVIFKYDSKGNKVEENSVDTNKKFSSITTYKYDDKNNETEENRHMGEGNKAWISTFTYDNRGFQVGYVTKDETGKFLSKMTQEYDEKGNKLGGASYSSDTTLRDKWKAVLDKRGRTSEMTDYKPDGSIARITKYKYDDWDNIIEDLTYKADGSIDTTGWNMYNEFEYDNRGNALKETGYRLRSGKKVMTYISERKYEYY